jgi:hypothetical protein
MSYVDISATEARGMYSPPNGNDPQILPDYWRSAPGEPVRTDLPELTDKELNALGWKGPIAMPPLEGTSYFTHSYEWNTETREYDVTELDEYEKRRRVNYQQFWDLLLDTGAYTTIKSVSAQSLEANTLATEFIALMSDAKGGKANVEKIQQVLTEIVSGIPFTTQELGEIQEAFTQSGMFAVYTLQ